MSLRDLLDVVTRDPSLARDLETPTAPALDLTGPTWLRPFVIAGLVGQGRTVLAVTATGREAEDVVAGLCSLVDPDRVAVSRAGRRCRTSGSAPRPDTVGRRLRCCGA